jgi:hypothetical protein
MHVDPEVPYYSYLNADSSHIIESQQQYIINNGYNYIITSNETEIFVGYELIASQQDPFNEETTFYLYRRIAG